MPLALRAYICVELYLHLTAPLLEKERRPMLQPFILMIFVLLNAANAQGPDFLAGASVSGFVISMIVLAGFAITCGWICFCTFWGTETTCRC